MAKYKETNKALSEKWEGRSAAGAKHFCENLETQASVAGWAMGNGDILTIKDSEGIEHNLLQAFGKLTMENIKRHAKTYHGQPVHQDQNSMQLFVKAVQRAQRTAPPD